jgi:hypothetical protein
MMRLPGSNSQKIGVSWNAAKHWLALRDHNPDRLMKLPDGQLCYEGNLGSETRQLW